jgi:hypothetical protein
MIAFGVLALLGAGLLRLAVPPSQDPGYQMPLVAIVLIAAVAAALMIVAVRLRVPPARPVVPPAVRWLGPGAAVAAYVFLALVWHPPFVHGAWMFLPMTAALALVVAAVVALLRWSANPRWTPQHLVAACVGALVGHTVFGLVANADTLADRLFLAALAVVTALLGVRLAGRVIGVPVIARRG